MGKKVECPIKRYPGTVTIPDPMTWDHLSKWGDFLDGLGSNTFDNVHAEANFLPGFVDEMKLEDFPTNFDTPPKHFRDVGRVLDWMMGEILQVVNGDEITPFTESASTNGSKE